MAKKKHLHYKEEVKVSNKPVKMTRLRNKNETQKVSESENQNHMPPFARLLIFLISFCFGMIIFSPDANFAEIIYSCAGFAGMITLSSILIKEKSNQ